MQILVPPVPKSAPRQGERATSALPSAGPARKLPADLVGLLMPHNLEVGALASSTLSGGPGLGT